MIRNFGRLSHCRRQMILLPKEIGGSLQHYLSHNKLHIRLTRRELSWLWRRENRSALSLLLSEDGSPGGPLDLIADLSVIVE